MPFEKNFKELERLILSFPKQFPAGREMAEREMVSLKKPENIIVCGMGGSALAGDILKMVLPEVSGDGIPLFVHRNYGIPREAGRNSLIFIISYSGNTEETISAFSEALKIGQRPLVISSGGKLSQASRKNNLPLFRLPPDIPPRMSIGYQLSIILTLISRFYSLAGIKNRLRELAGINPRDSRRKGKEIGDFFFKRIPLVYSSESHWAIARLWKIKFNENAKTPSFFNVLPEMNHNEMTGIGEFRFPSLRKKFALVLLRDKKDFSPIKKRMDILKRVFRQVGIDSKEVSLEGKDILEKMVRSVILADWSSFYLARRYGVDPVNVRLVEKFKRLMKK